MVMVAKLWGGHIAGPVAAVLALLLPVVQKLWPKLFGSSDTVSIWLFLAPLLLAVLLIWPAQYQAWKDERSKRVDEENKNTRPEIQGQIESVSCRPIPTDEDDAFRSNALLLCVLRICNHRTADTNITEVHVRTCNLRPLLFFHDPSVQMRKDGRLDEPQNVVLKYGISHEVVISASTRLPDSMAQDMDLSALEVTVTDGFGTAHSITPRKDLKLWLSEDFKFGLSAAEEH